MSENCPLQLVSFVKTKKVEFGPDVEPVSPNEFTQQLDGKELKRLLEKAERPGELDSDSDVEVPMVQANALPDVYPDSAPAKK